jgi:2-iminobutanoate/2-iminopropanoate deaminase
MPSRKRSKSARENASHKVAEFFGSASPFPISLAVRAGDFVITATLGAHRFKPEDVTCDKNGIVVDDGSGRGNDSIEDQTRGTMRNIDTALRSAGCCLEDVVDMLVWLRDPRDFAAFNRIYGEYFTANKPTRTVLRADFMFNCRIEMKATAFKPR